MCVLSSEAALASAATPNKGQWPAMHSAVTGGGGEGGGGEGVNPLSLRPSRLPRPKPANPASTQGTGGGGLGGGGGVNGGVCGGTCGTGGDGGSGGVGGGIGEGGGNGGSNTVHSRMCGASPDPFHQPSSEHHRTAASVAVSISPL